MKESAQNWMTNVRRVPHRREGAIAVLALWLFGWTGGAAGGPCSATEYCSGGDNVSCSTPSYGWGGSCTAGGGRVSCTWSESCGDGCTQTVTRVRVCPKEKLGS